MGGHNNLRRCLNGGFGKCRLRSGGSINCERRRLEGRTCPFKLIENLQREGFLTRFLTWIDDHRFIKVFGGRDNRNFEINIFRRGDDYHFELFTRIITYAHQGVGSGRSSGKEYHRRANK